MACSSRRDCNADELCILSGYCGGTTRNNEGMRSYCLSGRGGSPQREGEHASAIGPPPEALAPQGPPSTIDVAGLQEEVRTHMMAEGEDERGRERIAD